MGLIFKMREVVAYANRTPPPGYPLLYNQTVGPNFTLLCGSLAPVPPHLLFGIDHVVKVTAYSLLFLVSVLGNLTLFFVLASNLRKKRLLLHMNVADLIVTLYYMPREILHAVSIRWLGPPWLCQLCKFLDTFGVYLGSNVLMAITIDRFCCIMFPAYVSRADRKVNAGLLAGWVAAALLSLPQLELFFVATHPCYTSYRQCIAGSLIGIVPGYYDLANTVVTAFEVYILPFIVICVCYSIMFWKFASTNSSDVMQDMVSDIDDTEEAAAPPSTVIICDRDGNQVRRQTQASINRSQSRNFHMTAAMVILFLICWTPYFIAATLHFADVDLATGRPLGTIRIPAMLNTFLHIFAALNSVANPYLYGFFSIKLRGDVRKVVVKMLSNQSDTLTGAVTTRGRSQPGSGIIVRASEVNGAALPLLTHSQSAYSQPPTGPPLL